MTGLRFQELLVVLAVLLLFFGARKLPELARSLGHASRELRKGIVGDEDGPGDDDSQAA